MLDPIASKAALRSLFHRAHVAQLGTLFRVLKTHARRSVMRRLKYADYVSSYTHTGRYYTLRDIPRFDQFGLWHYGDVGFCRVGTLKAAVTELVEKSEAGRTLCSIVCVPSVSGARSWTRRSGSTSAPSQPVPPSNGPAGRPKGNAPRRPSDR